MTVADPRYRIASILLTLSLLGQGIAAPFNISSMAMLVMIIGLPILTTLALTTRSSMPVRRFTRYNLALFTFFAVFSIVGLLSGKIGYPSYLLSIAIYQIFYMSCLVLLGPIGVWHSLRLVVWINIVAVAIQIGGGLVGSDEMVRLSFFGVDKGSSIEYWGFLPRASGLTTEPAHLSYLLLPSLLLTLLGSHVNQTLWRGYDRGPFLVCYLLTMSIVAYLQLTIALIAANFQRRRIKTILLMILSIVVLSSAVMAIPFVRDRIDSALLLLDGEVTNSSSVFAIQSNFMVTLHSMEESPILGNGITSHRVSYEAVIGNLFNFIIDEAWQGLNQNDAGSLFLLLLSETGIVGFVIFLAFVSMAVLHLSRLKGELALLGLVHALALGVIGLRYGQFASPYIMLNMQIVLFCLAALAKIQSRPIKALTIKI
jgi:O-Antigen ligase